jgi:hypothetical protein
MKYSLTHSKNCTGSTKIDPELFMKVNAMNILVKKLIAFISVYFLGLKIVFLLRKFMKN